MMCISVCFLLIVIRRHLSLTSHLLSSGFSTGYLGSLVHQVVLVIQIKNFVSRLDNQDYVLGPYHAKMCLRTYSASDGFVDFRV